LITYNPENIDLKDDGIQNAIQIPPEVAAGMAAPDMLDVGINPYRGEQIQMGSSPLYTLPWDFTGGDPNIPLASQLELSNADMLLISSVNRAIVGWTRLESGKRGRFIYVSDSLRMYAHYSEILALLHSIGGGGAYADFAQVRASDEPRGPGNAPNRKTEVPGTSALQHTAGK